MLNRLFTASFLQEFLSDLSNVDRVVEEYESIDKTLKDKHGDEPSVSLIKPSDGAHLV